MPAPMTADEALAQLDRIVDQPVPRDRVDLARYGDAIQASYIRRTGNTWGRATILMIPGHHRAIGQGETLDDAYQALLADVGLPPQKVWQSNAIILSYDARIIDQRLLPADATETDLPATLERKCCPYKSCGTTDLYLDAGFNRQTGERDYAYLRGSNDEPYYGPTTSVAALVEMVNDRVTWPVRERD